MDTISIAELESARDQARVIAASFSKLIDRWDKTIAYGALALASAGPRFSLSESRILDTDLDRLGKKIPHARHWDALRRLGADA